MRVVLNVDGVKDYSASLLSNPPQLVIFLYSTERNGGAVRTAKTKNPKPQSGAEQASVDTIVSSEDSGNVRSVSERNSGDDPSVSPSNAMTRSDRSRAGRILVASS